MIRSSGNIMKQGLRISLTVLGMLILACLCGTAAASSLGTEWKERPYSDGPFSGVKFTTNGSFVYAGGEQLMLRSWDGHKKWGGKAGTYAAMSEDGGYVVQGVGQSIILMDQTMVEQWTRNMDGQVKALAISKNATFIITADDKGNYNAWALNGDFYGRTKDDVVKKLALSPTENIVVATTEAGLRIYSPVLVPIWSDNKSSSLDNYILISQDGKTIITAGANRLSSHTSTGGVNWVVNPTKNEIIDMACNYDCSVIILGSQDGTVQAVDRYGKTRWTYDAGQWVNAVAVSPDATVIAAGGLDGTVYLFDRAGRMTTQKKMDSNIRPRSLAVSRDGTRIAVADQNQLYGLTVLGDADPGVMETFTPASLDTVKGWETRETATPAPTIIIPTTNEIVVVTPLPPTPTQKSPAGILPVLTAFAMAGIVLAIRRR
jgi:WD40 repeat protein